jgi:hypothetical protein
MWQSQLRDCGFGVVPDVLRDDEVASLLASISEASALRTRAGMRHALGVKAVDVLAHDPRLIAIAHEVIGSNAVPFRVTLFDKSPSANWLVVWHQDTALPLREKREKAGWGPWSIKQGVIYAHASATALQRVVALRVHIDDSTAENRPLRILPGTHNMGILSDDSLPEVATRVAANDCVVAKGGILAMRPLVVHSSSKSQNKAARRVLHIEYAASIAIAEGLELATA